MTLSTGLQQWLSFEVLAPVAVAFIRAGLILIAALIGTRIVAGVVPKIRARAFGLMASRTSEGSDLELEKRAVTVSGIVRRTLVSVIWLIALIMALREAGFDVAPILAGAGVLGLAVGFGAQNLVRDVITGLFMLVENQVRVGDVALINGTGGLVEEMNLRTTLLRGLDGTVHIFPNGQIQTLSNKTREFAYHLFDIGVSYGEDTDRVVAVLREVADSLQADPKFDRAILEPLDVLGVDAFADSSVMIRARLKTLPMEQWRVGREMNRRIKKRFDKEGIEIPFPQRALHVTWPAAAIEDNRLRRIASGS